MASRQGVLKNEYSDDTRLVRREPFTEMYYSIPDSIASKDDIHAMSFFLSKDGKCYQYLTEYSNEKSLKTLIEGFDSPNSGLKRVDKSFRWVNMSKGYEIEIIPWKMSHGKWPVIYVLDIHLRK